MSTETLKLSVKKTQVTEEVTEVKLPYYGFDGKTKHAKIVSTDKALIVNLHSFFTIISDAWNPADVMGMENLTESSEEEFQKAYKEAMERINSIV